MIIIQTLYLGKIARFLKRYTKKNIILRVVLRRTVYLGQE